MLYIVATPIGNMEDITMRALRILKEVDYVFAEDTRQTKKLLNYYEIDKIVYQYHEHNKIHQVKNIVNLLEQGKNIALVTDAGTPCISDPGYEVVNAVLEAGIKVVPIPGATSMAAAASCSGVSMRRIAFEGFLPKKKGRQTLFNKLKEEERTIILFESPNRIERTLNDINNYLGNRYVVIVREITKVFEEIIRGQCVDVIERLKSKPIKGEIVLIIKSKCDEDEIDEESEE
jgi:16S rRNA (cytidine1402-2'-O)-methyltransferase